jgi:cytochrome P450
MRPPSLRIDANRVSLDPRDLAFVQDPYPAYDAIRAACPAFFWEEYGHWCLSRHDQVMALFKDRRFGRQILHVMSREALGWPEPEPHLAPWTANERHSLLELEPPDHTRLRTLVNRAFVSRQVERLRPRIERLAHELIDGFEAQRRVDLIEAYATPIPVVVIAELLGVPAARSADLLAWSHAMVAMYQFGRTRAVEDEAVRATVAFADFLRGCIEERRASPAEDLIGTLIAASDAGDRLSPDELVSTCILILNAGHEATVHGIGNAVKAIFDHGVDVAAADPALLAEEALRFDAPLHMFTRHALEDCVVFGVKLAKGDRIGLLLGAANRDGDRFPEPHRFDPARAPNPHASFGAGIHFCVGAPLARLEMEVALPILFARLPGLRLEGRPRYRDAYHFHGLERLDLSW